MVAAATFVLLCEQGGISQASVTVPSGETPNGIANLYAVLWWTPDEWPCTYLL